MAVPAQARLSARQLQAPAYQLNANYGLLPYIRLKTCSIGYHLSADRNGVTWEVTYPTRSSSFDFPASSLHILSLQGKVLLHQCKCTPDATTQSRTVDMSYSYGHSALIRNPSRVLTQNYCIMASSALLWYDFGLTLTAEIERIWRREFSCVSLAYVCMRFTMLIDRATLVLGFLLWAADNETCSIITHINDVGYILNLLATAGIVIIRVYGISAKNWKWLPIVLPLNLVRPILYAIESARYFPVQGGPPFGCTYDYTLPEDELAHAVTTVAAATMVASHGILVFVTLVKTFRIQKLAWKSGMHTPLATLLLRDGILFLILLVFNAFANFYATPKDSATIFLVWPYFYEIINVIILSHFILDLRGLAVESTDDTNSTPSHVIQFKVPKTGTVRCAAATPES